MPFQHISCTKARRGQQRGASHDDFSSTTGEAPETTSYFGVFPDSIVSVFFLVLCHDRHCKAGRSCVDIIFATPLTPQVPYAVPSPLLKTMSSIAPQASELRRTGMGRLLCYHLSTLRLNPGVLLLLLDEEEPHDSIAATVRLSVQEGDPVDVPLGNVGQTFFSKWSNSQSHWSYTIITQNWVTEDNLLPRAGPAQVVEQIALTRSSVQKIKVKVYSKSKNKKGAGNTSADL